MSGRLTTHVLDLARGIPVSGIVLQLRRLENGESLLLREAATNADGRLDTPLLEDAEMKPGEYELLFHAGDYFRKMDAEISETSSSRVQESTGFLDLIPIRFHIGSEGGHYHVPLLLAPGGYSTYRGS
ncbi:5-hydroxyisourate hydrolase [Paenibacillus sophorae]|uniref:5-hydroxyisourate hydrolase n=1 Tax=Paenibacillus sophorae TaxID=1333845 RepID=A0A1H8KWF5_9BACL|nr:hydroxyisourate hydrolase [Paenibacillus sophorae]QWU17536.1 hydroxyisourate hydrolase [Paenibacillus sophorae]SEN97205.1 5-hydroxyisourate hydrolase [Paenibacillus sophorae]